MLEGLQLDFPTHFKKGVVARVRAGRIENGHRVTSGLGGLDIAEDQTGIGGIRQIPAVEPPLVAHWKFALYQNGKLNCFAAADGLAHRLNNNGGRDSFRRKADHKKRKRNNMNQGM